MTDTIIEAQSTPSPARTPAPRPTTQVFIGCLVIPMLLLIAIGAFVFYTWYTATADLSVPHAHVLLVHSMPEEAAPLMARFGAGQRLPITGRSADWRWLEVELWNGQRGWTRRPLDILVWQLHAELTTPTPNRAAPPAITPVTETMIVLTGGLFTMGSPPGLGETDEQPAHTITLSPFAIDRTEVTVGQYWQCVQVGACGAPTGSDSQSTPYYLNDVAFDNHPAINIPWAEAKAYCIWRAKRLPTEAEWEMAAGWDANHKAKMLWPWGNQANAPQVNLAAQFPDSVPVGAMSGDRSPAGVLDMGGNVREWVLDWYKVDYYRITDETNPTGPSNRRGEGMGRVVRGASFADSVEGARTANRGSEDPAYGYPTVGFRCVQTVAP